MTVLRLPGGIACKSGDQFTLNAAANATGFLVRLTINYVDENGVVGTNSVDVVPNSDRSFATQVSQTPLPDGIITSANITLIAGIQPTHPGNLYVSSSLLRGGSGIANILSGYIYSGSTVAYPPTLEQPLSERPGRIYTVQTADPAAGAEIAAVAVPANSRWKLRGFSVVLVQGITQTPLPTLRIRDPSGNIKFQIPISTVAITASSTSRLTWGIGLVQSSFTAVVGDEFHTAPLPDTLLVPADDIGTITDGIGANTDYGVATLTVEEWIA